MEPFSLNCPTCGNRLRVKDRKYVGQILPCPKCKGMVLIEDPSKLDEISSLEETTIAGGDSRHPTGESNAASAPNPNQVAIGDGENVDSEAVTQDGITADPEGFVGTSAPLKTSWGKSGGDLDDLPDLSDLPPPSTPPLPAHIVPAAEGTEPGSGEEGPPVAWQSDAAKQRRQWAAIVTIAGVSLISAGLLFWWVVDRWRDSRGQPATVASDTNATDPTAADPNAMGAPLPPNVATADNSDSSNGPESLSGNGTEAPIPTEDGSDPLNPASPVNDSGASSDGSPAVDPAMENESGDALDIGTGESDVSTEGDNRAAEDSLFPDITPVDAAPDDDGENLADEIPEGLQQFLQVMEMGDQANAAAANQPKAPESLETLRVLRKDLDIRESDYPAPANLLNVKDELSQVEIRRMVVVDQPMDEAVRVLVQLSGVPIYMDLPALDAAGIRADVLVSVEDEKQPRSVAQILKTLVTNAKCDLSFQDGFVRIIPASTVLADALLPIYTVDDMKLDPDVVTAGLAQLMINAQPPIEARVEAGVVQLDAPLDQRVRAALLLNAMRLAVEAPVKGAPAMQRWIAQLDDPDGRAADWEPIAQQEVTFDTDLALPTELVLGKLARESDSALVLDWPSCWSHGLTPQITSLPWYRGRTVDRVVKQVVAPYVLEVRDVGFRTWWVGSTDEYESMPVIAVVTSSLGERATRARMAAAAGIAPADVPAMVVPGTQRWVVQLPRYVVRELLTVLEP